MTNSRNVYAFQLTSNEDEPTGTRRLPVGSSYWDIWGNGGGVPLIGSSLARSLAPELQIGALFTTAVGQTSSNLPVAPSLAPPSSLLSTPKLTIENHGHVISVIPCRPIVGNAAI
jgi:hypothetical protein